MTYFATLTLDYNRPGPNEYGRLFNAIAQTGWDYAETSALYYEADDLDGIRLALEVLARAVHTPGELSALSLQVQLVGLPREPPAARNHRQALTNVLRFRLPPRPVD